jgi:Fe-S-cluster containining protein
MQSGDDSEKIKLKILPLKFQCSQCGACCRRAGISGFMPDRGDGACIHLTKENMCSIYETRPDLCNMEFLWNKKNKELLFEEQGISKKDYFIENSKACNFMIKEDNMDEKFYIDLKKYNAMEGEMSEKDPIEEINGFEHNLEEEENDELRCEHCDYPLILTSIIQLNNQVNFRCDNVNCGSIGFIARGILYQTKIKED